VTFKKLQLIARYDFIGTLILWLF